MENVKTRGIKVPENVWNLVKPPSTLSRKSPNSSKKYLIRETLNLLTDADRSTDNNKKIAVKKEDKN